jgi:hypothetical protein
LINNSPIVNIDSIIFLNGFFVIYMESFNLQTDGTSLLILFSVKDPEQKFHQHHDGTIISNLQFFSDNYTVTRNPSI